MIENILIVRGAAKFVVWAKRSVHTDGVNAWADEAWLLYAGFRARKLR